MSFQSDKKNLQDSGIYTNSTISQQQLHSMQSPNNPITSNVNMQQPFTLNQTYLNQGLYFQPLLYLFFLSEVLVIAVTYI